MDYLQIVTFCVGDYVFGIPSARVMEVFEPIPITPVAKAPAYLAGVINVRGVIVTVVDLACILKIGSRRHSLQDSSHLILKSEAESISILADSIGDIIEIAPEDQSPCPFDFDRTWTRAVSHIISGQKKVIYVLHPAEQICRESNEAA